MINRTPSRLSPVIGLGRLIGLTFAVIAPGSSVFLTYGTAFKAAGTGVFVGYALGAVLNLAVMLGYAELGSRYPEAGGDYALAARALGRRIGSLYTVLFAVKGVAIPALLGLSTASYAHLIWPSLATTPLAMLIFLLYLVLSTLDLRTSSFVVNFMVIIEFSVFALFLVAALSGLHQPVNVLWHPVRIRHGHRVDVPHAVLLGTVTAALYGLNGPQSSLYYSEETSTEPSRFGHTIIGSALATIGIELLGVAVATLALPTLTIRHMLPLVEIGTENLGAFWGHSVLLFGITIALFDTGLATTMSYGRIFYAIARDHQWPRFINQWCLFVSRQGIPLGSLTFLGLINLIIIATSQVSLLVTVGGTILIVVYLGVSIASITTRIRFGKSPYTMPFWPLPSVFAVIGLLVIFSQLSRPQIITTLLIVLLGFCWSWIIPNIGIVDMK